MVLAEGVDYWLVGESAKPDDQTAVHGETGALPGSGRRLTVRAGRGAAVGVVTKGVDVETTLRVGVVAGDVVGDGGRGTLRSLLEDDGAGDLGVSSKNADCSTELARCNAAACDSDGDSDGANSPRPRPSRDSRVLCPSRLRRGPFSNDAG